VGAHAPVPMESAPLDGRFQGPYCENATHQLKMCRSQKINDTKRVKISY